MNQSYKPFYISDFQSDSGEIQNTESFLIPEKAFSKLEDAAVFRGKVIKRPGTTFIGRLRRNLAKVNLSVQAPIGAGLHVVADVFSDAAIDLRSPATGIKETYAEIEPKSVSITVTGTLGLITFVDTAGDGILVPSDGTSTPSTINYVTGELRLTIAPVLLAASNVSITFDYFPCLPVMGLQRRENSAINDEQSLAFDTKYSYEFLSTKFRRFPLAATEVWSGQDWNLFCVCNYYQNANGRLYWATNNNMDISKDPIRYCDGTTWTTFMPYLNGGAGVEVYLQQCRVLVAFKNRLIAMNIWEGHTLATTTLNYVNKIRWSWNGDPTDQAIGWNDTVPGRGGYLVAPTNEAIIGAAFIRDQLIVKFERSSWKLVYTGNENLPFVFQKVDSDLGSESQFSLIQFDKGVLAIGDKGVTLDDSVNVTRVDQKVPNAVFSIQNADSGVERCYGIRDFASEVAYFSYPNGSTEGVAPKFPNKVLVYNYLNETWAKFNDSFTCYGYYQKAQSLTWADYTSHDYHEWEDCGFAWNAGVEQSLFPDIAAGNQEGFVLKVSSMIGPEFSNAQSLKIHNISESAAPAKILLTIPYHNLQSGQFIKIRGIIGTGATNPNILNFNNATISPIFKVVRESEHTISLTTIDPSGLFISVTTSSLYPTIPPSIVPYTGVYWGGGTIIVLNNFDIRTKQFSPFYEQGSQCRLGSVDLFTSRTPNGQLTANLFIDCDNSNPVSTSSALFGSNVIYTKPENLTLIPWQAGQDKIWHKFFTQAICQNFTLQLTLSDIQMCTTLDSSSEGLSIHALAFYLSPNARLVQ